MRLEWLTLLIERKLEMTCPFDAPKMTNFSDTRLHHGWRKFWNCNFECSKMARLGWLYLHHGWKNFEIVTGDIVASLSKANILVGSMTTACLEAMGLGIPVIVLEQPYGLFGLLTIPRGIPQNFWKYCTSAEDIFDAINYFRSKAENSQDTRNYIRENYFEQVTKDSIVKFLELK